MEECASAAEKETRAAGEFEDMCGRVVVVVMAVWAVVGGGVLREEAGEEGEEWEGGGDVPGEFVGGGCCVVEVGRRGHCDECGVVIEALGVG